MSGPPTEVTRAVQRRTLTAALDSEQTERIQPMLLHKPKLATGCESESDAPLAEAIRHIGASWASEIAHVDTFRADLDAT